MRRVTVVLLVANLASIACLVGATWLSVTGRGGWEKPLMFGFVLAVPIYMARRRRS